MKVTVNVECTPEEARAFLGLPDVRPMQDALMAEIEARMHQALQASDPDTLFKTWLPAGLSGVEQVQKFFWNQMMSAVGGGRKPSDKSEG